MKNTFKTAALVGALALGAGSSAQASTSVSFDPTVSLFAPFVYSFTLDEESTVDIAVSSTEIDPFYALLDQTDFDDSVISFTTGDEAGSYTLEAGLYSLFVSSLGLFSGETNVSLSISPVPLPAALPLMATALFGAGFVGRRRKDKLAA